MSGSYKIEKNIDIPIAKYKWEHWPFAQMKIGDSFLVGPSADSAMTCRSRGLNDM